MKGSQQILIISNFYKIKLSLISLGLASLFLRSKLYWKSIPFLKAFEEQLSGKKNWPRILLSMFSLFLFCSQIM